MLYLRSWISKPESTCTESDNANITLDVNPATNVDEMDSDDQEDDNLSCLENKIINEDNSSNVESPLGLDNDKTLNILDRKGMIFGAFLIIS